MTTAYKPVVKKLDDRIGEIEKRRKESLASGKLRREFKFRTGEDLPLITLPIDDPIYRLENYRTRDQQLSLIAAGKVEKGAFESDRRELSETQKLQHELLLLQAKTGSGESIKPIYDELERVAEQTEDIIISFDGIVVNGNRRLSAMRELFTIDPVRFKGFGQVLCAVLPASATAQEILQLEIGLQMQPETKLPYEWTALGRAVRDLRDAGVSDQTIAQLMNRDKIDVARAAKMIDSADIYLGEWLQQPDSYNLLDGTEQAFRQIAVKNLGRTEDAAIREVTRKFDFFVIEERTHLTDRAYNRINAIEGNPELFLESLATEMGIELVPAKDQAPAQGIFFGAPVLGLDYSPLIEQIAAVRGDEEAAKGLVQTIEQVCELVKEQGRNREHAALEMVRKARKTLAGVDVTSAAPGDYGDILATLEGCDTLIDRISAEIAARKGKGN